MDGTWEPIGGLEEERTADEIGLSFESLEMLATLVKPANSYVWAFTGRTVSRTKNAVAKSPRAARVIFNVDEGDVNVLDIAKTHAVDYDLGDEEVTVFVVQEFKADFVEELDDVRHDPIEVTLDKNAKKELLANLSQLSGGQDDELYWDACLREHAELQVDVFLKEGEPAGAGPDSPALHGLPADHHNHQGHDSAALPGLPADHRNHQGQTTQEYRSGIGQARRHQKPPQLPGPEDLNDRCRSLRKTGSRAKWECEQGFLTMLCVDPLRVPLHEVGPGRRSLRWTAIRGGDAWRWTERTQTGKLDNRIMDAEAVLVYYGWDQSGLGPRPEGDHDIFAETTDISTQEKRAVLRSHVNLGHPGRAEFVRLLKAAGCRAEIIQYVQREFKCAGCDLEQRPPSRLPSATPRTYDFNVVIGIDVLFVHGLGNKTEHPVLNVTCLGALYSTFGMIDPLRRSAKLTLKAFERLWVRTFGPPDFLMYDMGTEFTGSDFQSGIERMCIQPIVCDHEAPWENGVCERRGDLFKKVYYKSREIAQPRDMDEVELLIFESAWALQTTINRSGFTPAQRVLGRQPRVALDLTSDDRRYELLVTQDKAWNRASELRDAARKALMELDAKERLQRANRSRPRSQREGQVFSEGQPVVVLRQGRRGALAKVGPCFVVLQRGSTVWVTRRGELWKCDASQVFAMGPLEVQGLEVIPRDLLMAKERLRFDNEKLGFVDVTQENQPDENEAHEESDRERPERPRQPENHGLPRDNDDIADLPSDVGDYSPDEVQEPQHEQPAGAPSVKPTSREPPQEPPPGAPSVKPTSRVPPPMPPRSQPATSSTAAPPRPTTAPEEPPPTASGEGRGQWKPNLELKQWVRYDHQATRFRVSSSEGPMWNDVVRLARSSPTRSSMVTSDHGSCHGLCLQDRPI